MGYSADTCGFLGACFLFSGMTMAIITGPIVDRYFTYHLARLGKVFGPIYCSRVALPYLGWYVLYLAKKSKKIDEVGSTTS